MPVLVRHAVACTSSILRYTGRAAAFQSIVIGRRKKSTHSGPPQSRRTKQLHVSTSSLSTPPNSLDTGRPRRPNRTPSSGLPKVSTLDHTRLTSDNFLILSGVRVLQAQAYRPSVSEGRPDGDFWQSTLALPPAGMASLVFPPHARGYLYYHLASNAPALSGQVRFRVTGTNNPALFASGEDLLRADHLPWRIPVLSLAMRKQYAALFRRVVDDGLVPEHVLRTASSLPPGGPQINAGSSRIVHAFGQPFRLAFGQLRQAFYFVGADTVWRAQISPMAVACTTGTSVPSMTGSALCHFEKSPRPEHAGRRVVVCRIVRILERVEATGIYPFPKSVIPQEGELMHAVVGDGTHVDGREWSFDVDHFLALRPDKPRGQFAAGLALLYDNEERAGGPVGW